MDLISSVIRSRTLLRAATVLICWASTAACAEATSLAQNLPRTLGELDRPNGTSAAAEALRLGDAVVLTMQRNPEVAALAREVSAFEGTVLQAGLRRNPAIGLEDDGVGGVGRSLTLRISQLVELGGKRRARVDAASRGRELARYDLAIRRADVLTRLAQTFVDALAAERRSQLAVESFGLAQRIVDVVDKRVQAEKVSPVELTRARAAAAAVELDLDRARRESAAARARLGAFWGDPRADFRLIGDLESLIVLPPLAALADRVAENPELAQRAANVAQRAAVLEVERTRRTPDVLLSAGVRRQDRVPGLDRTAGNALVFSAAVGLPLFDRNQGNVLEAAGRLGRAHEEERAMQIRLNSELAQVYEAATGAERAVRLLRANVLPAAASAYEASRRGYELGRFSFLDVLDAQRTLFQNRAAYIQALADYQRLIAELERITAGAVLQPMAAVNEPAFQ